MLGFTLFSPTYQAEQRTLLSHPDPYYSVRAELVEAILDLKPVTVPYKTGIPYIPVHQNPSTKLRANGH
jgi:hypothetical protein